jgi:hypothetical protein
MFRKTCAQKLTETCFKRTLFVSRFRTSLRLEPLSERLSV